jgi:type VI protein secretion system component VasK
MKKQLIAAGVTASVAVAGLTGLSMASAATQSNSASNNPMSSLVSALATKFNLKTSDVQAVFDEQHTQMEAQRNSEVKTKLAQLVKDGKLTQAQADAITAKRSELQKQRDSNRASMDGKTHAERKTAMDTERSALDTWFSDNNISTDYRYLVFGGGRGHGGPGGSDSSTSDSTPDQSTNMSTDSSSGSN